MNYDLIGFVILVVDKMAGNGTGLEGTAGINCTGRITNAGMTLIQQLVGGQLSALVQSRRFASPRSTLQ
jgi:hypothetical protein